VGILFPRSPPVHWPAWLLPFRTEVGINIYNYEYRATAYGFGSSKIERPGKTTNKNTNKDPSHRPRKPQHIPLTPMAPRAVCGPGRAFFVLASEVWTGGAPREFPIGRVHPLLLPRTGSAILASTHSLFTQICHILAWHVFLKLWAEFWPLWSTGCLAIGRVSPPLPSLPFPAWSSLSMFALRLHTDPSSFQSPGTR